MAMSCSIPCPLVQYIVVYGHLLPYTMPPGVEVRACGWGRMESPPAPESVDTAISERALEAAK
ncbi:hypothetical protein KIPB_014337, partial [Kipferlia bialata]|eukprot:g14337.t1